MRYGIGFDERTTDCIISDHTHHKLRKINLFPLMAMPNENESISSLRALLDKVKNDLLSEEEIVTSFEPLNGDIRDSLQRQHHFKYGDYDRLITFITKYIMHFRCSEAKILDFLPGRRSVGPTDEGHAWEPYLYGRYGIVELRVIENYLRNPASFEQELKEILCHLDDEGYMYRKASRPHWLSVSDVNFNLRTLMTNAGFYMPVKKATLETETIQLWANEYLSALVESKALFPAQGCYPNYLVTQDYLFNKQGHLKDYVHFPNPERFYDLLEGHTVLLLTPFYQEVNELFGSGKIFRLYTDIRVPTCRINAVPAFISTYPNRPHGSWSETFNRMKEEVDRAFQHEKFSIFFASCGCYGMPICRYVHKRYGIASVYYGNHINTLFGVRQACSENFLPNRRILENWAVSHLRGIQNMEKIDGGRYV